MKQSNAQIYFSCSVGHNALIIIFPLLTYIICRRTRCQRKHVRWAGIKQCVSFLSLSKRCRYDTTILTARPRKGGELRLGVKNDNAGCVLSCIRTIVYTSGPIDAVNNNASRRGLLLYVLLLLFLENSITNKHAIILIIIIFIVSTSVYT